MFRSALTPTRAWVPVVLALTLELATACGDPSGPSDVERVEDFLLGLPTWQEFSPEMPSQDEISGEGQASLEFVDGAGYDCVTTPYSITETPDKIVTLDPDANVLYVGALLQGKGYKEGIGSLAELPIRQRAPLAISIDLLAAQNTRTVQNPDLASVTQAVGELVNAATEAGNRGGTSVSFSQENTYSVRQAALKLGLSAGYMGVSVRASLGASRTARERTVTAYFVQKMFTVSVVLPETPSAFFSADFTPARLQEQVDRGRIGPDNLPVYVANVVYGRILIFSFTSTANITDIRAALAASYGSIAGGSIEARYLDILNQAQVKVVTVGGEGRNATALIRSGELRDYFQEDAALTSARPISYTVRNLGDNSIAKVSETTSYNLRECTAVPTTGTIEVDVDPNDASVGIAGPGGFTFNSTGDQMLTELVPGGYRITSARDSFVAQTVDVDVRAGETTPVHLSLIRQAAIGGEYRVLLTALRPNNLSCTGESEADLYYDLFVNSVDAGKRAEGSSTPVRAGQTHQLPGPARTVIARSDDGSSVRIHGSVWDADGGLRGPPDKMADYNIIFRYPNVLLGDRSATAGVNGCSVTLFYSITKIRDISP